MKPRLAVKKYMIMMGILALIALPILSASAATYEIKFDPYFIGKFQRDNLIVVNDFADITLRVMATAYDPVTGEQLDSKGFGVDPSEGASQPLTLTHPEPHASRLVVKVIYEGAGFNGDGINPPFSVTRILTNKKTEGTILQVRGVPTLLRVDTD